MDYLIFKKGGRYVRWIRSSTYLGDIEAAIRSKMDAHWWTKIEISPSKPAFATVPPSKDSEIGLLDAGSPQSLISMDGQRVVPFLEDSQAFPNDLASLHLRESGSFLDPTVTFTNEIPNDETGEGVPLLDDVSARFDPGPLDEMVPYRQEFPVSSFDDGSLTSETLPFLHPSNFVIEEHEIDGVTVEFPNHGSSDDMHYNA